MTEERNRQYTELCDWGPLLSIPGVHWINLQYDECTAEVAKAEKAFGATIHQWRNEDLKSDLESVVGLLWNLDFVITAPTAVSSLAGGVGVATLELDAGGDWTTHGEERSPWFPSIRVIRRPSGTLGWGSVIERVADEVRRSVGEMVPR